MLHKSFIPSAVVVLALAAPAAAGAMPGSDLTASDDSAATPAPASETRTDLRSPDARDAATPAPASETRTDLRSPDARDAASAVVSPTVSQDLRAPDTRDAAIAATAATQSVPAVQTVTRNDGFEWSSAGIGAAAMLAIVLALAAAAAFVVPRRRMAHADDALSTRRAD